MGEQRREGAPGGSGNSGEEFWSGRGGLGRAKAWASYCRVRGTLHIKAGAQDQDKSASHRASAANQRGQTPLKPNWPRQGGTGRNRAWERTSHLGAELGVTWRCAERLWLVGRRRIVAAANSDLRREEAERGPCDRVEERGNHCGFPVCQAQAKLTVA
jgi:hypothetical protein